MAEKIRKEIQFLRNNGLLKSVSEAKQALEALLTNEDVNVKDGSIYLARYGTSDSDAKTLVGVARVGTSGNTMTILTDASDVTDLTSKVNGLQSELDKTQTGAGLNVDGTYKANSGDKYIGDATSLNDADLKISTALKAFYDNAYLKFAEKNTVSLLQSELDKTQTSIGLSEDGSYTSKTGNYISGATSLTDADSKLDAQIKVNADAITAINGNKLTGVTVNTVTGKVSNNVATITLGGANINLTSYVKGSSSEDIGASDTVNSAFGKIENKIAAIEEGALNAITGITAGNGIEVSGETQNKTISTKIKSADKVLSVSADGIASTLSLSYDSEKKKIYLYGITSASPEDAISTIDAASFIKDGMIKTVELVDLSKGGSNPQSLPDGKYIKFTFNTDASTEDIYLNVNDLVDVYKAGDGLSLSSETNTFSIKLDSSSDDNILSISSNGLKISGISAIKTGAGLNIDGSYLPDKETNYIKGATSLKDADKLLDTKIHAIYGTVDAITVGAGLVQDTGAYEADSGTTYLKGATSLKDADSKLDAQIKANADAITAINGNKLTGVTVNTVTGKVSSNVATITLGGANINLTSYVKGSSSEDIGASDTVNSAFGKLENKISSNKIIAGDNISISTATTGTTISIADNAIWDCGTYDVI